MSVVVEQTPGLDNANAEPISESSIQRATAYPVIKDSLSTAYDLVHRNSYSAAAYDKIESISTSLFSYAAPRLPLKTVDGYANTSLDYVEKKFPIIKSETKDIIQLARGPADNASAIAKTYADGIQARISPVAEQFSAQIAWSQQNLHGLHERLTAAIASLPRDKASASEAINNLLKELENFQTYAATNAKELPANLQAAVKPVIDNLSETAKHISDEFMSSEGSLSTKATNILVYSKDRYTPLLTSLTEIISKKKAEAEDAAPKVNGTH